MNEDRTYKLFLSPSLRVMLIALLVIFSSVSIFMLIFPFTFKDHSGPPAFLGFLWIIILTWNLFWILRIPHKIILYKDGLVEFISVLRKVKVQARDIKSIKPEGPTYGFLVVTAQKKIRILAQFDDFHDFLSKIKILNPLVVLHGC